MQYNNGDVTGPMNHPDYQEVNLIFLIIDLISENAIFKSDIKIVKGTMIVLMLYFQFRFVCINLLKKLGQLISVINCTEVIYKSSDSIVLKKRYIILLPNQYLNFKCDS